MIANQIALPVEVRPDEIARKNSLGAAIKLCAELAGHDFDKQFELALNKAGVKIDKAQLSRWQSNSEGVMWEKLSAVMDLCGNDAPLLWMLFQRGYDLTSLRKVETELQRENRELREQVRALKLVVRSA